MEERSEFLDILHRAFSDVALPFLPTVEGRIRDSGLLCYLGEGIRIFLDQEGEDGMDVLQAVEFI